MEPTTEPRTEFIVAIIDLVFNALSVVTNLVTSQLPDLFTQWLNALLGAFGIA